MREKRCFGMSVAFAVFTLLVTMLTTVQKICVILVSVLPPRYER
jgi:hypothetical protein